MTELPNLMRPNQLSQAKEEERRLEKTLSRPDIQDRGLLMRQLRAIKDDLATRTPQPFDSKQIDIMVQKRKELQKLMSEDGMPTQEEMRRNPPGTVGKLRRWEERHKANLKTWKYLVIREHAGLNDPDTANFEKFRPRGGSGEMNMDGAQIPKTNEYYIPHDAPSAVVMDEEASEILKEVDPDVHAAMGLLTNEQRTKVLELIDHLRTNPKMDLSFEEDKVEPKMNKGTATLPKPVQEVTGKRLGAQRSLAFAKKRGAPEEEIAEKEAKVMEMKELETRVKEAHRQTSDSGSGE